MSVGGSFKVPCPSCEAMVLVKDPTLIGKKVECPKCKDRFVIPKPAGKAKPPESAGSGKPPSKKSPGPEPREDRKADAKPPLKKKPIPVENDEDSEDDVEEPAAGKKKKKKKAPFLNLDLSNKKTQGILLAGVGVVVLAVAAVFILLGRGSSGDKPFAFKKPNISVPLPPDDEKKTKDDKKDPEKDKTHSPPPPAVLTPAGNHLTQLLPPDAERVSRIHFLNLLEKENPLREIAFHTPGTFDETDLKKKLGFSVLAIDDWIRAERISEPRWSLSAVHVMENLDMKALTEALGLRSAGPAVKGQEYFRITRAEHFLEQLSRLNLGVPVGLQLLLGRAETRPTYLRLVNSQTLVFADEPPLLALLNAGGTFPRFGDKNAPAQGTKTEEQPADVVLTGRGDSYLTISPALKVLLDEMETPGDTKEKILFSSAAAMIPLQLAVKNSMGKEGTLYRPGLLWEPTAPLDDLRPRLRYQAGVVVQRSDQQFEYRIQYLLGSETEGREFAKEMVDIASPRIGRFGQLLLGQQIALPSEEVPPVPMNPEKKEEFSSAIQVNVDGAKVHWKLKLELNPEAWNRAKNFLTLAWMDARSRLDLTQGAVRRQAISRAALEMATRGISERQVLPGHYPPGAFARPASSLRMAREPNHRISWMAGLLPFLGQETLYKNIHFESSWRSPGNWPAGSTLVPQFLDPSYPESAFTANISEIPVPLGATHFVGIAGVGLDAADYPPKDPAYLTKRGILGYDLSAGLEEVKKGHGLSNTILVIQVPHDALAGIHPWIAGGGGTLRGVPEKNSIAPFVLTLDKNGKDIQYKGRAGTYALMADGSVRFLSKNVSDPVFQSMCTIQGPLPANFQIDNCEETPLIPDPTPVKKIEEPKGK